MEVPEEAGGDHVSGGGGYTGGNQERDKLSDYSLAMIIPVNGNCGNPTTIPNTRGVGGGYFKAGNDSIGPDAMVYSGVIGGGGAYNNFEGWSYTNSGDGGVAGKGGTIRVSSNSKIYAFNGNRYTDGTAYNDGANQCPIYAQNGELLAIRVSLGWWTNEKNEYYSKILGRTINYSKTRDDGTKMIVYLRDKESCQKLSYTNSKNGSNQGIGSGAGYIELDNGTYKVESSLN